MVVISCATMVGTAIAGTSLLIFSFSILFFFSSLMALAMSVASVSVFSEDIIPVPRRPIKSIFLPPVSEMETVRAALVEYL